ncbi:MAG: ABC transporter permease [Candidatus Methylomirabilales bacterium]
MPAFRALGYSGRRPPGLTLTADITALACHQGLAARGSATEIPQATRRAVIQSFVAIIHYFCFCGRRRSSQ